MNKDLEKAQNAFMQYVSEVCDDFGLNRFIAQLYAMLYLCGKPMSLDEMTARLGVSKGNVSLNIRELERWGAVKKVWVKGSRRDYYEADPDIKKVFLRKFKSSVQKRLDGARKMLTDFNFILASCGCRLKSEDGELLKIYKNKLRDVEKMVNLSEQVFEIGKGVYI